MAQFFVVLWKLTVSPNICCQLLRLTIVSTVGKISDNFQLCLSINPKLISDFRLGNGREFLGIEAF